MIQAILSQAVEAARPAADLGQTATYIPELGKMDKHHLGACVFSREGERCCAGDTDISFSIQSISKVISLAVALELCEVALVGAVGEVEAGGVHAREDELADHVLVVHSGTEGTDNLGLSHIGHR